MNCKHILVVDDDAMIRTTIMDILDIEGYESYSASNGKDALDLLISMEREKLPGCIILDLKMPVMDGQTFLKNIHSLYHDSLGRIPVIVASANGNIDNAPYLEDAVERWEKPIELDDIFRVAHKYCGDPTTLH